MNSKQILQISEKSWLENAFHGLGASRTLQGSPLAPTGGGAPKTTGPSHVASCLGWLGFLAGFLAGLGLAGFWLGLA